MKKSGVSLLLSDACGVFIPQIFCYDCVMDEWGLDPESWAVKTCLAGPETDGYWDAWEEILNKAVLITADGCKYYLHQDGDLWALCPELMTAEEKQNFGWDEF